MGKKEKPRKDKCATPHCRKTPVLTYLNDRICQECWDLLSKEKDQEGNQNETH